MLVRNRIVAALPVAGIFVLAACGQGSGGDDRGPRTMSDSGVTGNGGSGGSGGQAGVGGQGGAGGEGGQGGVGGQGVSGQGGMPSRPMGGSGGSAGVGGMDGMGGNAGAAGSAGAAGGSAGVGGVGGGSGAGGTGGMDGTGDCGGCPSGDICEDGFCIPEELEGILAAQNQVRAETAEGLPPFEWSEDLEGIAAEWAANCRFMHRSNARELDVGENLYANWPAGSTDGQGVVDSWAYDEMPNYNYQANSCEPPPGAQNPQCGHYTQIVWRDTTQVGCAKSSECPASTFPFEDPRLSPMEWELWVCNYRPPGNDPRRRPY